MTQDEIIEMGKQAGMSIRSNWAEQELEAFAKLVAAKAIAELESQERNFCPRCGKRTNDIHTCTPPQDNT
jgi:NADH pyrophosphatase NudC (nudix superfamily)